VAVYFVSTGTAANSLALAAVNRPGGVSFCHREAHMLEDECGAPEFFTHGARLAPVDGDNGKIDPDSLNAEIQRFPPGFIHAGQPMAISITQSTEIGTLYQPDEIAAIADIAKFYGLPLHMDGARFANALVALNLTPAEMTWKRGVDIVSFGATKNGCWCAEALVFMNPKMAKDLPFIRKRAAQLLSKSRFIACQFDAYLQDGLWLTLARHANTMAKHLQNGIVNSKNARLAWHAQANEVFCVLDKAHADQLQEKGAVFYQWNPPRAKPGLLNQNEVLIRLVTSFATEADQVDRFLELLG
jgi:threonine aldolase